MLSLDSQIGGTYNPAEIVPILEILAVQSNLGMGNESMGSLETFQTTSSSRVRESYAFDSRRTALPVQREQNEPAAQRQNYVRDGHGNRNPGNGQLVDTGFADTSGSRPKFEPIRLPAVSLPVSGGSIGLPQGKGQGNLRCLRLGEYMDSIRMRLRDIKTKYGLTPDTQITVCDSCFQASCWLGEFMCDECRQAGTTTKTVKELRTLNLEHPYYWAAEIKARTGQRL